jgi:SAM-dependent methyltransferase
MKFNRALFTSLFSKYLAIRPESQSMALGNWKSQQFGQYLLDAEKQLLARDCANLSGYRLMHLGLTGNGCALEPFDQLHQFYIRPSSGDLKFDCSSAVANYDDLPLPSDTLDVAIIQHALEYSESPQAVLSEAARVLAPGGHLILCVFNPLGPMGLTKWPMRLFTRRPEYDFFGLRKCRIHDWLSLLNCEVTGMQNGAYNLPIERTGWLEHCSFWERTCQMVGFPLGNFYMIHAVKRVAGGIRNTSTSWRPLAAKAYGTKRESINQSTTGSTE